MNLVNASKMVHEFHRQYLNKLRLQDGILFLQGNDVTNMIYLDIDSILKTTTKY